MVHRLLRRPPLHSRKLLNQGFPQCKLRKDAQYKRASTVSSSDIEGWGKQLRGSDIVQDIVTDCSFVAALEVAAEHDHLFGGQLATSALYPQDSQGRIQQAQTANITSSCMSMVYHVSSRSTTIFHTTRPLLHQHRALH